MMHQFYTLENMTVKTKTAEILKTLIDNRERHSTIVAEARKGYVEKARIALKTRLDDLESGKIIGLSFDLRPPIDHTYIYDTAIQMLELHEEEYIHLSSQQVRNLYMDEWDWMSEFLVSNSRYSKSATELVARKKLSE